MSIYDIKDENRINKNDFSALCASIIRMGMTDECRASKKNSDEKREATCIPQAESIHLIIIILKSNN
jgi:hypothetical protein